MIENNNNDYEVAFCPRRRWAFENNESIEYIMASVNCIGRPKSRLKDVSQSLADQIENFFKKGLSKEQVATIMEWDLLTLERRIKRYGLRFKKGNYMGREVE